MVPPNEASQRRAAAALIRPAEVGPIAAQLAPWVGASAAEGELIASWCRQLRYLPDQRLIDVWQAPLATLTRGGGDCEDLAIAALSLLLALGGSGVLVIGVYYSRTGPIGHAWLEGWDSAGWFHVDATTGALTRFGRPPTYLPYAMYTSSPAAMATRAWA